jgi:putative ABC transport system permease protein
MRPVQRLAGGVRALFRRRQVEADLDAELREFLQASVDAKIASGMDPDAAARAARIELGSPAAVKEWVGDVGWEAWVASLGQDVRYAGRMLRRDRGFAAAAIGTLALGIGTTLAIFTLADGMLFRPLPYRDPGRLALIMGYSTKLGQAYSRVARVDFEQLRTHHSGLSGVATVNSASALTRIGPDGAEAIPTVSGTPNLLELLGVGAHLGRPLRPGDETTDPRAVMLTFEAWQRRFGGDPAVIGRTVVFDQMSTEVVGILPRGFSFPVQGSVGRGDLLMVKPLDPGTAADPRAGVFTPIARLKPGVSFEQAQSETDLLIRRAAQQFPETAQDRAVRVANLQFALFELNRPLLWLLLVAAGAVMLIVCVNLANLLLAQGRRREREIGIRTAIGASRARVARQLLVESLVLGVLAGVAALAMAAVAFEAFSTQIPSRYQLVALRPDARTFAFTVLLSLLASTFFGIVPAFRLAATDAAVALRETRRTGTGRLRFLKAGAPLVVVEVALCVILLAATALTSHSLIRQRTVDLGLAHKDAVALRFVPPAAKYSRPDGAFAFQQQVLDEVRALPGVTAAAIDSPQVGGGQPMLWTRAGELDRVAVWSVTPNYFATTGVRLLEGRDISEAEARIDAPVAVIGESVARAIWPGESAIGRVLEADEQPPLSVIGVVSDVRSGYGSRIMSGFYRPIVRERYRNMTIMARSSGEPATLGAALKTVLQRLDPAIVVSPPRTIGETLSLGIQDRQFQTFLFALFGLVGLLVAAVGIYGVMTHWVGGLTRELGVRLALGAEPGQLEALVLRHAAVPLTIGLVFGSAGAFMLTKRLESLLYEVTPRDPATLTTAILTLLVVGLAAAYVPARRAARVDPLVVLKAE